MNRSIPDTLLRNGVYQFKKRVPKHLVATTAFGGKQFVQRSLKTRDPREARQRASEMDADFLEVCARAEREISGLSAKENLTNTERAHQPTDNEVNAEIIRLKNRFLATHHRGFDTLNNVSWNISGEEVFSGTPEYVWVEISKELQRGITGEPDVRTTARVDHAIQENGWAVTKNSGLYAELCRSFAAAEIEAIDALLSSKRGDFHTEYNVAAPARTKTLEDAIEHYKAVKPTKTKMVIKMETALRAWTELVGKQSISSITRTDIRSYISNLLKVPLKLRAQHPGTDLKDLIEDPRSTSSTEKRLSPRTIKDNYIAPLSTAINCLIDDHPEKNPFDRIKVDGATRKSRKRKFKDHELNSIFRHPIFTGCMSKRLRNTPGGEVIKDHYYWAPIIALWTGMRANEIASLELPDIRIQSQGYEGKPHFRIREGKSENARRDVPIHPQLLKFGLDDYVALLSAAGHSRLFPHWKQPRGKSFSSGASQKNFNNKVILCCDDDNVSFHTFRHTLKNAMANARIPEQYQRAILGHELLDRDADYLHPELDDYYDEFVEKVDYPNVDLSHLEV